MPKKDDSVNDLIKSLKQYYDNSSISVHIPTLNTEIPFKILTIKQHRELFNIMSNPDNMSSAVNVFNNLILNACSSDYREKLTVLDRVATLLSIRMHLFGDDLKVKNNKGMIETVNIRKHLDKCTDTEVPSELLECIISDGEFELTCKLPSIERDSNINAKLGTKLTNNDNKTLGHLFIYELIKYIQFLKFNDNTFEFSTIPTEQQIQICEMLPISISSEITNYINSIKVFEEDYLKVSDNLVLSLDTILLNIENE